MKINLTQSFKDLKGEPLKDGNGSPIIMGQYVADFILAEEAKDSPMHSYELATKLFNASSPIEITESEKVIITRVCKRMRVVFAAQILLVINNPIQDN